MKTTINERFRILREQLKMSQEEFGNKMSMTRSGLSNIENGVRRVSDRHILLVVTQFGVNETWLRTGEGEMFVHVDPDEELAYLLGALAADGDAFKTKFITAMAKLDDEQWALVEKFVSEMCSRD